MHPANYLTSFFLLLAMALQIGCGNSQAPLGSAADASAIKTTNDVSQESRGETNRESRRNGTSDSDEETMTETSESTSPLLSVGRAAPPLNLSEWVMGDPVDSFEADKTYVIEFWATWCPPCRDSMPHLSKLQSEYGDAVTFIGISDEDRKVVDKFLATDHDDENTWADIIQYSMAIDTSRTVHANYMEAARQNGIPAAFIVGGEGIIEWIGHPMQIDRPLEQIASGTWDRVAEVARHQAEAEARTRMQQAARQLGEAQAAGDYDKAIELIDGLIDDVPGARVQLSMAKVSMLLEAERTDEATTIVAELAEENWENSDFLNGLAWSMATEMEGVDLANALTYAKRASEIESDENGSILDTVARVCYEQGDLEQAIEWQEKAVEISASLQSTLDEYESELKLEREESEEADGADSKDRS